MSGPPADARLRPLAYFATAVILLPLAAQPARDLVNALRLVTLRDTPLEYADRFALPGAPFSPAEQIAAARYINERTQPGDRIAVYGYDAPALYLSGRPNATRFSYALPLSSPRSTAEVRESHQREYLDAIAAKPAYIIVGLLFPTKAAGLAVFPALTEFLRAGYVLERSFGGVDLYRRIDAAAPPQPPGNAAGAGPG